MDASKNRDDDGLLGQYGDPRHQDAAASNAQYHETKRDLQSIEEMRVRTERDIQKYQALVIEMTSMRDRLAAVTELSSSPGLPHSGKGSSSADWAQREVLELDKKIDEAQDLLQKLIPVRNGFALGFPDRFASRKRFEWRGSELSQVVHSLKARFPKFGASDILGVIECMGGSVDSKRPLNLIGSILYRLDKGQDPTHPRRKVSTLKNSPPSGSTDSLRR